MASNDLRRRYNQYQCTVHAVMCNNYCVFFIYSVVFASVFVTTGISNSDPRHFLSGSSGHTGRTGATGQVGGPGPAGATGFTGWSGPRGQQGVTGGSCWIQ